VDFFINIENVFLCLDNKVVQVEGYEGKWICTNKDDESYETYEIPFGRQEPIRKHSPPVRGNLSGYKI
jgi:hypothetical protein